MIDSRRSGKAVIQTASGVNATGDESEQQGILSFQRKRLKLGLDGGY